LIYRRRFDGSSQDSLAKLARWIRPGSRVLELGAAAGYFTEHLRERGCSVDVVEIDPAAAREAAAHAARTIVADLDADRWVDELRGARYDAIVCADVIEHLRDGRRLLERLRGHVAEGGELLMSVPNVAHSAVIARLVDERFEYGGEGLLDPTHVRLYTWRSLAALLAESGFGIVEWDATIVPMFDSEFRVRVEALAPALREALVARPHANVYQWLVRAVPGDVTGQPQPGLESGTQYVTVRLLRAVTEDALSLERAEAARLPVNGAVATLDWRVTEPSPALRILLADRVGVVEVRDLSLHAGREVLWSSAADEASLALGPTTVALGASTFALVAPDAWVAPMVAPALAARADRVSATLAWPESYAEGGGFHALAALAEALRARDAAGVRVRDELHASIDAIERRRQAEERAHEATRATLAETHAALFRRDADVAKLEHSIEGFRAENARLDAALAAQERIIAYRQSLRWWLKLPVMRVKWWWHRAIGR
jgi:SAM-dependent methyltransferase